MPSIEMKEIRIPSALMRERRPSILYTFFKATFTALLAAVFSFFLLNVCAIAVLALVGAVRQRMPDFPTAYRDFAAPAAVGIFVISWLGAMIFFFRERSR